MLALLDGGDASDWDAPFSITEAVRYLEPFLIGKDPFDVEKIWWNNTQIFKRMGRDCVEGHEWN